mmetsp:Transcript_51091/g.91750  ORF Transcript_51091/g.91750 Transcript_51091/m.91750 type:complete len:365 (+) Transcript_51091:1040-2134(+)
MATERRGRLKKLVILLPQVALVHGRCTAVQLDSLPLTTCRGWTRRLRSGRRKRRLELQIIRLLMRLARSLLALRLRRQGLRAKILRRSRKPLVPQKNPSCQRACLAFQPLQGLVVALHVHLCSSSSETNRRLFYRSKRLSVSGRRLNGNSKRHSERRQSDKSHRGRLEPRLKPRQPRIRPILNLSNLSNLKRIGLSTELKPDSSTTTTKGRIRQRGTCPLEQRVESRGLVRSKKAEPRARRMIPLQTCDSKKRRIENSVRRTLSGMLNTPSGTMSRLLLEELKLTQMGRCQGLIDRVLVLVLAVAKLEANLALRASLFRHVGQLHRSWMLLSKITQSTRSRAPFSRKWSRWSIREWKSPSGRRH